MGSPLRLADSVFPRLFGLRGEWLANTLTQQTDYQYRMLRLSNLKKAYKGAPNEHQGSGGNETVRPNPLLSVPT